MPSLLRKLIAALPWRTLRRVHKDRRARALLWQLLLPILFLIGFTIYVVVNKGTALIAIGIDVVLFTIIIAYRRRRPAEKSGPVTLDLTQHRELEPLPEIHSTPELLRELTETTLLHAILAHRAASEGFLKHKGVPEGQTVITRQTHIRLLREYGMYDRLGRTERDLLLSPDGSWDEETIDRASMLLEAVRVFRWLLQLDATLPLIGEASLLDFRLAAGLLDDTKRLFDTPSLVGIDEIRTARTAAESIFYRCYSEGLNRGFYIDKEADHAEEAIFYAQRLDGRESEDVLIGHIIVSRATDDEVRLAASTALRRLRLLRWTQDRLYGTIPVAPELTAFDWR